VIDRSRIDRPQTHRLTARGQVVNWLQAVAARPDDGSSTEPRRVRARAPDLKELIRLPRRVSRTAATFDGAIRVGASFETNECANSVAKRFKARWRPAAHV
jgi:hypothetical protein